MPVTVSNYSFVTHRISYGPLPNEPGPERAARLRSQKRLELQQQLESLSQRLSGVELNYAASILNMYAKQFVDGDDCVPEESLHQQSLFSASCKGAFIHSFRPMPIRSHQTKKQCSSSPIACWIQDSLMSFTTTPYLSSSVH